MRRKGVLIVFVSLSLAAQLEIPEIVVYGEREVELEPLSLPSYEFINRLPIPEVVLSVKRLREGERITPLYLPPDCKIEAGGHAGEIYGGFLNAYFQHTYFPSCVIIKGGSGGINEDEKGGFDGFADIKIHRIYTSISIFNKEFKDNIGYIKWNGFYSHRFFDVGVEAQSMFLPKEKGFLRGFFDVRYENWRFDAFVEGFLGGNIVKGGEVSFGKEGVEIGIGWKECIYPVFAIVYPLRDFMLHLRVKGDAFLLSPERLISFNPFFPDSDFVYFYRMIEGGVDWWKFAFSFYGKIGKLPPFTDTLRKDGKDIDIGCYVSYRDKGILLKGGYSWNNLDYPSVFFEFGLSRWITSIEFRIYNKGCWLDFSFTLPWRDIYFGVVMRNVGGMEEYYPDHRLRKRLLYAFLIWKRVW